MLFRTSLISFVFSPSPVFIFFRFAFPSPTPPAFSFLSLHRLFSLGPLEDEAHGSFLDHALV